MTDQPVTNQPKLSLEEELDVLEAVYKIGKEKGLDLLRPEQIKKLTDAGRVGMLSGAGLGNQEVGNIGEKIQLIVQNTIRTLLSYYPEVASGDEWNNFNDVEKKSVVNTLFGIHYGISIGEYTHRLENMFVDKRN